MLIEFEKFLNEHGTPSNNELAEAVFDTIGALTLSLGSQVDPSLLRRDLQNFRSGASTLSPFTKFVFDRMDESLGWLIANPKLIVRRHWWDLFR